MESQASRKVVGENWRHSGGGGVKMAAKQAYGVKRVW